MKSATALAARPAPQPLSSQSEVCPGQVPLPIGGFPPVTDIASQSRPDASLRQRSGQFAQVIAEVLSGLRPARQVQSWLLPQVYNQLQRTLRRANRGKQHPVKVASVHIDLITAGAAEVVVRMESRGRSHAMALRLEKVVSMRGLGRWHCTALSWA